MGRLELLAWLNRTLQSDYASVQECGDGVAYCQLLDALHRGKVPLHALDYGAKYLSDNERNVRVLSRTMMALGLDANVDFEAVANGKFTVRLFDCLFDWIRCIDDDFVVVLRIYNTRRVVSILFSCERNRHRERLTRETRMRRMRIPNSQENHNLLRWFYAYVEKNGTAAVDAYDAYGARVAAQKRREQIELKRKEGARGGSGSETSRTTPTLPAGGSSGGSLSERFVPNDLSVVREMEERETPVMGTSGERVREEDEGDLSFEFSPLPQADGVAPATPRALAFPDTPDATTTGRRRHSEESTEVTTTSPVETRTIPPEQKLPTSARSSEDTNGRRPPRALDRWATKARAKLAAAHPDPSSSPSPLDPNSDATQTKHSATVEEETVSCCGCVVKRVVRRLVNANPPQSAG